MTADKSPLMHTDDVRRYFDSLSSTWEHKYAADGSMRKRLDRFAVELKGRIQPPAKILDFGCGTGDLACHLAYLGFAVEGVDQVKEMTDRASRRFRLPNLSFTQVTPTFGVHNSLAFPAGYFQACVSSSVLEYVSPTAEYFAELRRVVAPSGHLIVTVPNPRHPIRIVESVEIAALKHLPGLTRVWPSWRTRYLSASVNRLSPLQWRWLLNAQNWELESVTGWGDPLLMLSARAS